MEPYLRGRGEMVSLEGSAELGHEIGVGVAHDENLIRPGPFTSST